MPDGARLSGKPIPPILEKKRVKKKRLKEPEEAPAIGPPPADSEVEDGDLHAAIEDLYNKASERYSPARAEVEKMDRAMTLIGEAMELLKE